LAWLKLVGHEALVLGKPSPTFFSLAVSGLHCHPGRVAMIGGDVEADVGGAMAAGLMGALVRTGKYQTGQEARLPQRPTFVAENLKAAVVWLLESRERATAREDPTETR
jgi:ribonucleotide monophosphatase NagD (HAD superfamily)